MKFTENEMTVAVDAAARYLFGARQLPWRRRRTQARWDQMKPFTKYQHRSAAGEMVLPTLTALPERPTYGARPAFTAEELTEAAEAGARGLFEHRSPGGWEKLAPRRRKALIRITVLITRLALEAMPVRPDPEAPLQVPDHL